MTRQSFLNIKQPSVHYTKNGTEETAVEIDKVGADGLKATEGTVKEIDKGGKNLVVVAGDGTQETFKMTGHATKEAGAGIGKGSKVTVFYTGDYERSGKSRGTSTAKRTVGGMAFGSLIGALARGAREQQSVRTLAPAR